MPTRLEFYLLSKWNNLIEGKHFPPGTNHVSLCFEKYIRVVENLNLMLQK